MTTCRTYRAPDNPADVDDMHIGDNVLGTVCDFLAISKPVQYARAGQHAAIERRD